MMAQLGGQMKLVLDRLEGGDVVLRRQLIDHLYANRPDGGALSGDARLGVIVHRLRQRGYKIELIHGYRLVKP